MLAVKTILHPTDFSAQADTALELARTLARDYAARVILMHVREISSAAYGDFGGFPINAGEDRKELQAQLAELKRRHEPEVVDYFLADGDPATEIVARAKKNSCDMIIMGTHGRTGLARLLMGSVAEQVVRKASCPVLIVKTSTPAITVREEIAVGAAS